MVPKATEPSGQIFIPCYRMNNLPANLAFMGKNDEIWGMKTP